MTWPFCNTVFICDYQPVAWNCVQSDHSSALTLSMLLSRSGCTASKTDHCGWSPATCQVSSSPGTDKQACFLEHTEAVSDPDCPPSHTHSYKSKGSLLAYVLNTPVCYSLIINSTITTLADIKLTQFTSYFASRDHRQREVSVSSHAANKLSSTTLINVGRVQAVPTHSV